MNINILYGLGGLCEPCHPSHDHPLNNILSMVEEPEDGM